MIELKLQPWRRFGVPTFTRTIGQLAFRKNGTMIDIWLRIDGKPRWFAVRSCDLVAFLADDTQKVAIMSAESDSNAEGCE